MNQKEKKRETKKNFKKEEEEVKLRILAFHWNPGTDVFAVLDIFFVCFFTFTNRYNLFAMVCVCLWFGCFEYKKKLQTKQRKLIFFGRKKF